VSFDRIIPWQFAPQQMPASVSSGAMSYPCLGFHVKDWAENKATESFKEKAKRRRSQSVPRGKMRGSVTGQNN